MEEILVPILKGLVLIPITLLPIINPLSTAPVFVATVGNDSQLAKRLARQIAINSWFVVVISILIGTYVLDFFGISLPVVRLGGGLLVAATGWRMLHRSESDDVQVAAAKHASKLSRVRLVDRSFFPLTFPLTTGPGTIATAIALGAQAPHTPILYLVGAVIAALGAGLISIILYWLLRNSSRILTRLGDVGMLVMMRLVAFVMLCIGIQFIWNGWAELNGLHP